MPEDPWSAIQAKLGSAGNHLRQARTVILPPSLSAHYVAIQSSPGAIVSNPNWRLQLNSHLTGFLVDCRSIPDVIQSYFGRDPHKKKSLCSLPPDEADRRGQFQNDFAPLYRKFAKLPLSRARVDTVHGQGFPDIWVRKSGKLYSPLQHLPDTQSEFTPGSRTPLALATSIPSLQWAATLPRLPELYLHNDFFFRTAGRRYKPLFPEFDTYLQRTAKLVASARKLYEKVHSGHRLTRPPRTGRRT
jgi:hypothetical protein